MKLMSDTFWRELRQNIRGLDGLSIKKATIVLDTDAPALLYLEVIADRKEGRLLTKTYELVEVATDETEKFLPAEDDDKIEVTNLSSVAREWTTAFVRPRGHS